MSTSTIDRPAIQAERPSAGRGALAGVLFVGISFAVAAIGGLATARNVDGWYAQAEKAAWNPPNWLFGPVWSLLYPLMAVAAWFVWRRLNAPGRRPALVAYVVQLALNGIWTPVFFGLYPSIGAPALWIGLAIIIALDVAVLVTMVRFWPVSRLAAFLLIPYWAWVLFATTLNAALAVLNS